MSYTHRNLPLCSSIAQHKDTHCIDTLDTFKCKYFNTRDIFHASSTLFRLLLLLNIKD